MITVRLLHVDIPVPGTGTTSADCRTWCRRPIGLLVTAPIVDMAPWTETMTVMPSSSSAAVKVYEQWKYPAVGVVVGVGVGGRVSLLTGVHVQGAGLPSRRLNAVGVPRIAVAMIAADPVLHVDLSVASRRGLITRSITPLPWFAEVKVYLRLGDW